MWNYSYMTPSFLVLMVFLTYYFVLPRLNIRMNRTFLGLMIVQVLVLITDLAASLADEAWRSVPGWLLVFLNMLFFLLFQTRGYCFFRFTCDILRVKSEDAPVSIRLAQGTLIVSQWVALSSFFTGAVFRVDSTGYHSGPFYWVINVSFLVQLLLSYRLLEQFRDRLNRYHYLSALSYHAILYVGIFARILMPRVLIMDTFCLLAIIILYLSFENPELYMSNRGSSFNMRAFRELLEERMGKKPFRILAFALRDYVDMRAIYGGLQMDRGVSMIGSYLAETFPHYDAFYLRNGRFSLVGAEEMDFDRIRSVIYTRFQETWTADNTELDLDVSFVQIDSSSGIDTADRIINYLLTAFDKVDAVTDRLEGLIDPDSIRSFDHQAEIKRSLEKSIEQNEVEIFLQPLIDGKSRQVVGAEVLSRIRDPEGKLIPPSLFVPIAEQTGRINLMGEQVLEKTCQFIRSHDLEDLGLCWLNVNLSPIQCMKKDLSDRFLTIIDQYGVPAERIRLEITEQSVLDIPLLEKQIQTLCGSGFRFSLDDYGSGYSNLTRVKRYPFVNIKLDMEVVWDYIHDHDQLLPTIVKAFKQMNFTITAEGIETEEMADAMCAIGCDYLQGYLFSRPLPVEEFVEKYRRVKPAV